ncbi:MAG: oligosaccharide flippase family protein [Opitutales bacterium]
MSLQSLLRSSVLMGGAQAVTMLTGLVRAKVIAAVAGPAGIGLMGVLNAFNSNLVNVAGWGVGTSAVRTVASANEAERGRKVAAARQAGAGLAGAGLLLVLVCLLPVGQLTFASQRYALELLLAGLAVPCMIATGTWSALLQAGGHLRGVAGAQVTSSVAGLVLGLPFVLVFGTVGIALSILIVSVVTAAVTWRAAARLVPASGVRPGPGDVSELLRFGVALQAGNVVGAVAIYLFRVLILRSHGDDLAAGLADAGHFHAAYIVAFTLPGVIFSANSSDFYPRVAAAKDETEARVITERQVRASLLLAVPVLMALLTLGPIAVRILYAEGFEPAAPMVDWLVWSTFCNLVGWPYAFWVVARRSKRAVLLSQSLVGVGMVAFAFLLVPGRGGMGAAMAQSSSGLLHAVVLVTMARFSTGVWIGRRTLLWAATALGALIAGRWSMVFAPSPAWGVLPAALAAAVCFALGRRFVAADRDEASGT